MIFYLCTWCRELLRQEHMPWYQWLLGFGLIRRYRCPHCHTRFYRLAAGLFGHRLQRDRPLDEEFEDRF